jgi:hypothetical protein
MFKPTQRKSVATAVIVCLIFTAPTVDDAYADTSEKGKQHPFIPVNYCLEPTPFDNFYQSHLQEVSERLELPRTETILFFIP